MAKASKFKTISQAAIPSGENYLFADPLVVERTVFSPTRTHRYTLFRHWGDPNDYCSFIGMNPSGADALNDDRTIAKCTKFAKRWGCGALYMLNAFALRATDSDELYQAGDPVGPENDHWIRQVASAARMVVVAWGRPGGDFSRGEHVSALLKESCDPSKVLCFGRNKDGTPVHPLYQRDDKVPMPFFSGNGEAIAMSAPNLGKF